MSVKLRGPAVTAVTAGLPSADERQMLELIDYLDRRGMLSCLVAAIRRERPGRI